MSITDSLNDIVVPSNKSSPPTKEIELSAPSYEISEVSIDETNETVCDHAVMHHDKPRTALIVKQSPNSPDTSNVLLQETSPLVICNASRKSFQAFSAPPRKQPPAFLEILQTNSGRSQNSFRSLLGDRKRWSVHPCRHSPEIVIGAIVGESDLIIADRVESTDNAKSGMTVKRSMRTVSSFVRDFLRCMRIVSKPFQMCARKEENIILLRAEGYLT